MLQDKAEICVCLVFALEVFAVVDVEVVKLDKADEVAGRLALPLGHVVNSRRPQLEESRFP